MIVFADGFDHYGVTSSNLTDGAYAYAFGDPSTAQARTGPYSFAMGAGSAYGLRRVYGSPETIAGVGLAIYLPSLPSINQGLGVIQFASAGNNRQLSVSIESTGAIAIYQGDGETLLTTSDALLTANGWNHIEAKIGVDDTTGYIEVRLNQVTVVNLAGINSDPAGTGEVSQVSIGNLTNRGSDGTWYIDDLVGWDGTGDENNDFIGDRKVFTDFPDSDTTEIDWTPLTGATRFAMVDEASPDGDTSYDQADEAGQVMGLAFPTVDTAVLAISAVVLVHKSRKTDAGTCSLELTAVHGSDTAAGADRAMTTAYTLYHDVFQVDPATASPWTPAGVNATTARLARTS